MVALLHPNSESTRTNIKTGAPVDDLAGDPADVRVNGTFRNVDVVDITDAPDSGLAGRPKLRLVIDNTAAESPTNRQLSGALPAVDLSLVRAVTVIAVVVFGSLFVLRSVQGAPAADAPEQTGGAGSSVAAAGELAAPGPGDGVVLAKSGDSMWSIAVALAPNSDPRPVVAALIEANGTDSVQIGQQIVIPEQLLD